MNDLVVGQTFYGVVGELIKDHDGNRKRVITIAGQIVPYGIYIECSKSVRERCVLGTLFKVNVSVSRKPTGGLYLHSLKKHELLTVGEWEEEYGGQPIKSQF
jgi:hypothetical protein